MNYRGWILAAACLLALQGRAATPNGGGNGLEAVETRFHAALNRTQAVTERGYKYSVYRPDMTYMESLLAPGFLLVTPAGKRVTRSQWLDCIKVGNLVCTDPPAMPLPTTTDRLIEETLRKNPGAARVSALDIDYDSADSEVHTFGGTGIVLSTEHLGGGDFTFSLNKKEAVGGAFRYPDLRGTRVYAKKNGKWKLAYFQLASVTLAGDAAKESP